MQRAIQAQAYSRAFDMLAGMVARGLAPEHLEILRSMSSFAGLLPKSLRGAAADKAAAEHYTVFGLNVFANASVFLEADAQLGGATAERSRAAYAALGFTPPPDLEADALPAQLRCLSFLCGVEADALEQRRGAAARHARRKQSAFLRDHLLPWLPPLSEALARQSSKLYAEMSGLMANMCFDHYAAITPQSATPKSPLKAIGMPGKMSVRAISRHLLTPAQSGIFLSRDDLVSLARSVELPASFGERVTMLGDLFHAAGQFERLPALLDGLDGLAERAQVAHRTFMQGTPGSDPFVAPWIERLNGMRFLLVLMRDTALQSDMEA